ncbi:basic proline-rich protein-like [Physeter macrocephalus]|uniref:Basic proline-rich protein-like n=1 Tax=Physeter macrocephalus TaxID=9755 RepID=A0A2Y9SP89_PHYMC|nr:basic proline-rich protein-like [Physeter catodon]|eukprot:XP_023978190.1 basic proline-rich protein-like [Physeter catodon]
MRVSSKIQTRIPQKKDAPRFTQPPHPHAQTVTYNHFYIRHASPGGTGVGPRGLGRHLLEASTAGRAAGWARTPTLPTSSLRPDGAAFAPPQARPAGPTAACTPAAGLALPGHRLRPRRRPGGAGLPGGPPRHSPAGPAEPRPRPWLPWPPCQAAPRCPGAAPRPAPPCNPPPPRLSAQPGRRLFPPRSSSSSSSCSSSACSPGAGPPYPPHPAPPSSAPPTRPGPGARGKLGGDAHAEPEGDAHAELGGDAHAAHRHSPASPERT